MTPLQTLLLLLLLPCLQDPVFMDMAREMQESMLAGGMGGLNLGEEREGGEAAAPPAGMPPGMPPIDPNKYMEVGLLCVLGCGGWVGGGGAQLDPEERTMKLKTVLWSDVQVICNRVLRGEAWGCVVRQA